MSKSKRLVDLIMVVNAKKKFTVNELAEEFGVSYRTMLRDLQELGELGVPLYSEVGIGGGYRILKERMLPPISFTESEALAIFFASQTMKYYKNLPFENESSLALKKFYHYLPIEVKNTINEMNKRLSFLIPTINVDVPFLKNILDASIEQKIISIIYDSETSISEREIQPIGLYTNKGLWYCPAYCFKNSDFRLFRVDRIKNILSKDIKIEKINLDNFTIYDWFKYNDVNILEEKTDTIDLMVKLTKKGVKKYNIDILFSGDITLNNDGSGILKTKISVSCISWIINYFLAFAEDAIVIEPDIVRKEIKKTLQNLLDFY
ncbi:MAG: YafY family protein [Cyanobacteriota bacterium]